MDEKVKDLRWRIERYLMFRAVYGDAMQLVMAIEELSELQKEITKELRGKGIRDNIIEEIADVEIMLEQLTLMFQIDRNIIDEVKVQKIDRAISHIQNSI